MDASGERTILKFDSGARGFKRMMIVLGIAAVVVLLAGAYFLLVVYPREFPR